MNHQAQNINTLGVVGAGTMGMGIVQSALQAGHAVMWFDVSEAALARGHETLSQTFIKLRDKGKITAEQHASYQVALTLAHSLANLARAEMVIEAIIESLPIKQALFADLEAHVAERCLLASNTSSLSLSEIAQKLAHPERFVGVHFFNPVPLMPLVEVIAAAQTEDASLNTARDLMQAWGKTVVCCKDTPGFIVNCVARPFYGEAFKLLEHQLLDYQTLDQLLVAGGQFVMGPCTLTDLIGQDVNYAITLAIWQANYYHSRYEPVLLQKNLVDSQRLGRKNGRGFYDYCSPAQTTATQNHSQASKTDTGNNMTSRKPMLEWIALNDNHPLAQRFSAQMQQTQSITSISVDKSAQYIGSLNNPQHESQPIECWQTTGLSAWELAQKRQTPIVVFDYAADYFEVKQLAFSVSVDAEAIFAEYRLPISNDLTAVKMSDTPGLVNLRVISMIINEACEAVLKGVASPTDIDIALKNGVRYPKGAFEWLDALGHDVVFNCLNSLKHYYGRERYAASPWLIEAHRLRLTQNEAHQLGETP